MKSDDLLDIIKNRRSVRVYEKKPVPKKIIEQLIEAARWAPSACNLQHWQFVYIKDQKLKEKLAKKGKIQKQIIKAPTLIIVFSDSISSKENYANIQSVSASIMNILLMAHSMGLATNWVCGFDYPEEIRKILKMPKKYEAIAIIMLGYPKKDIKIKPPVREPIKNILHKEEYSKQEVDYPENINLEKWSIQQLANYQARISRRGFKFEKIPKNKVEIIFRHIRKKLHKNKILDFNSYSGIFLSKIQKEINSKVLGQFLTKDVIDSALIYNPQLQNKNLVFGFEKIKEKDLDLITSFFRLEHLPNPLKILKDFNKALNKNGRLLIVTRNRISWRGVINFYYLKLKKKNKINDRFFLGLHHMGPLKLYTKKEIKEKLKKAGFTNIKTKGLFLTPHQELTTTITYRRNQYLKLIVEIFKFLEKLGKRLKLNNILGETLLILADKK